MGLISRFLLRRIPAYVDGGLNIVDVRDVAAGHLLADAKGKPGERYILGGRNFTLQRLFADLSRICGVPAPPVKLPAHAGGRRARRDRGGPRPAARPSRRRDPLGGLWWTYSSAKAKRELGFAPRPHEETLEDALESKMARARRPRRRRSGPDRGRARARRARLEARGEAAAVSEPDPAARVVLYRCPTPTDFLCPCGAVSRRLRELGVEHRTERVPYGRRGSRRAEIEELTGQTRVPLLSMATRSCTTRSGSSSTWSGDTPRAIEPDGSPAYTI